MLTFPRQLHFAREEMDSVLEEIRREVSCEATKKLSVETTLSSSMEESKEECRKVTLEYITTLKKST